MKLLKASKIACAVMVLVAAGAVSLSLLAPPASSRQLEIPVRETVRVSDRKMVEAGVAALLHECPGLNQHADLLEWAIGDTLAFGNQIDPLWHRGVEIRVKIDEDAPLIDGVPVGGNTCYYRLGLDGGMRVGERACVALCADPDGAVQSDRRVDTPSLDPGVALAREWARDAEALAREVREANALGTIDELRALSMRGDYQAQRNLAFRLAHGDAAAPVNRVEACAWRIVILTSGRAGDGDVLNKRADCERLAADELTAALAMAIRLGREIGY